MFYLPGLSFREYLNFKTKQHIEPISYEALIKQPQQFDTRLSQIPKVTGLFHTYLQYGYYPFLFDEHHRYYEKIAKIIDQAVYEDIVSFRQSCIALKDNLL